jgi:ABC-type uncharacterized transport system substrate-binding protein
MSINLAKVFPATFIILMIGFIISDIISRPRILIIYSYKSDSALVREEEGAIASILNNSDARPIIRRHFMGMDKSWSGRSLNIIKHDIDRAIADFRPRILISMDDEARAYIAREYGGRNDVNIIFGGVDETIDSQPFFEQKNVTGILEKLPLLATQELLKYLSNKPLTLMIIGDASVSAQAEAKQIIRYDWGENKLLSSIQIKDFQSWQEKILENSDASDIIFITGYRQLRRSIYSDDIVPGQEVIEWTSAHTKSLLFANDNDFIEDGGIITLACSPREQAREAALLALKIIAGKNPTELPIKSGQEFFVHLSKSRLKNRDLLLPQIYESSAQASATMHP